MITDTIVALATPVGRGGIGVIRISGPQVAPIAQTMLDKLPPPREAIFTEFKDNTNNVLDQGIALYFQAPHSFTGEDILELQGHGGVIVMDQLLNAVLQIGARLARPGEFSERAFLNGKIDLAQAEAIADLINSTSTQAARCALRSLQGGFSQAIHLIVEELTWLRTYVEAGIDFVDEEIDLLADGQVLIRIRSLLNHLEEISAKAYQGFLLKEGMHIVLVGEPNVGKSSLLNCLAGRETAIVTPIPGTTRDIIREQIHINGMPVHIIDTAGLHETEDEVEQEGMRRTHQALEQADLVILLLDDRHPTDSSQLLTELPTQLSLIIRNKIDLTDHPAGLSDNGVLYLSAQTGEGIDVLRTCLQTKMGLHNNTEGDFMARRRHLDALRHAEVSLTRSLSYVSNATSELLAEELRQTQHILGEITGEFTTEDLLGNIFSSFCIGK